MLQHTDPVLHHCSNVQLCNKAPNTDSDSDLPLNKKIKVTDLFSVVFKPFIIKTKTNKMSKYICNTISKKSGKHDILKPQYQQ